jgi:DNA-binding HxlR family transcriptional regulator
VKTYRQYCPIARASEILAQRWTPIIIRDLLSGPTTYSKLADGAPGLSRTLLTTRLRELQRLGLVETIPNGERKGALYRLTASGEDLSDVLQAIGNWGERWLEVAPEHADPGFVLNSWCKTYLAIDKLPQHRVIARFDFPDQPKKGTPLWLIFDGGNSEVCRKPPGFEEDLIVTTESVALAEWHLGRLEWEEAIAQDRIKIIGLPKLAKALPTWNQLSRWLPAAHPPRKATKPSRT